MIAYRLGDSQPCYRYSAPFCYFCTFLYCCWQWELSFFRSTLSFSWYYPLVNPVFAPQALPIQLPEARGAVRKQVRHDAICRWMGSF